MAIDILDNGAYSFNPSTNTVTINRWIPAEDLTRIVNATGGGVIYDPTLSDAKASSYSSVINSSNIATTVIVLLKNCSNMLLTDDLQIYVDDASSLAARAEAALDPVDRLRVSQIQSLIDTDFEYSLQQGRWENLGTTNNRPYAYSTGTSLVTGISAIASTAGSRTVTITLTAGHGIIVGDVISIQDTYFSQANGVFTVDTSPGTTLTYTARTAFASTEAIYDSAKTVVYKGSYYTGSQIIGGITVTSSNLTTAGAIVTVTTTYDHGLSIGNEIEIDGLGGTNPPNGSYVVNSITGSKSFTYFVLAQPSSISGTGLLYARSQGLVTHRPADGGVVFSANAASNYEAQIRQTRRYFRYQAGKGISMASGIVMKPNIAIDAISVDNSFNGIAVYTKDQHNLQPGTVITLVNCNVVSGIDVNGDWTVSYLFGSNILFLFRGTHVATTAAAGTGTIATITTTAASNLVVGDTVIVAGVTPTGYNTTGSVVTAVSNTSPFTVSYANTTTGAQVTAGNLAQYTPNYTKYVALGVTANVSITGEFNCSVKSWYGASNKIGMFDQQNGAYWDFDGITLSAVRRFSTYQIAGRVNVTNNQTTVTGSTITQFATKFNTQLKPGDYIVIRGVSYRVDALASDTSLTISPAYRGPSANNAVVTKTNEVRIPSSLFNLDKLDGTGSSGYNIDLSKMQMLYVDYSWYGAGSIRFGVRDSNGKIIYAHKIINNNTNYEAFMRSGSLPARYETITAPPKTYSTATLASGATEIVVASTIGFPPTGTLAIKGQTVNEYVNYAGLTSTSFTGLTRGKAGNLALTANSTVGPNSGLYASFLVSSVTDLQVGQRIVARSSTCSFPDNTYITNISGFSITTSGQLTGTAGTTLFSAIPMGTTNGTITGTTTAPIGVELAYPYYSPNLSHWGTSVLLEGRVDNDGAPLINYTSPTTRTIPASTATLSNTSSSGNVVTCTTTLSLQPNMVVRVTSGTGAFSSTAVTTIVSIDSGTTFTVTPAIVTTLSSATLTALPPTYALFSIRLAPSVDNGIPTNFGIRDLINRMQVSLKNLSFTSNATGNLYVTLVLNSKTSAATTWNTTPITNNSLVQVAEHVNGTIPGTITGNASSFTQVIGGDTIGGFNINATGVANIDLSGLPALNNSILGGGSTTSDLQFFPDGPDVLTVCVKNLGATATGAASLSWNETQA